MGTHNGVRSPLSHKLPVGHGSDDTVFASEAKQSPESATYREFTEIAASLRSSG